MEPIGFSFLSRWKEELVCSSDRGSFVLVFAMGRPTVYLPSQERWSKIGPKWARQAWAELHDQLRVWCEREGVCLVVDDESGLYEL
ncbi:MAG: hypothetical protein ACK493_06230 [Planctomycetota bacterium]|jgi:hypothetical protein